MRLVEIRPGFHVNPEQIVSIRERSDRQDESVFAVMQLSSGAEQTLTRDEFTTLTGMKPSAPVRADYPGPSPRARGKTRKGRTTATET